MIAYCTGMYGKLKLIIGKIQNTEGDVEEVVPAVRWKDMPISEYGQRKPPENNGTSDVWRHFSMYEMARQRKQRSHMTV